MPYAAVMLNEIAEAAKKLDPWSAI
jgi:hypothetical protein